MDMKKTTFLTATALGIGAGGLSGAALADSSNVTIFGTAMLFDDARGTDASSLGVSFIHTF